MEEDIFRLISVVMAMFMQESESTQRARALFPRLTLGRYIPLMRDKGILVLAERIWKAIVLCEWTVVSWNPKIHLRTSVTGALGLILSGTLMDI
jgi:hypothetical protein